MQMLSDMKAEAVNGNLTEEKAKEIIDKYTKQYGIDLTAEYYEKLSDYLIEFSNKEYSKSFIGCWNYWNSSWCHWICIYNYILKKLE